MLDDARLIPMTLLLALPLPFVGMGGAIQGLQTRNRRYRALAARTLIGQGAGMAVGIGLAYRHAGAWAPVVQQAVGSLLSALVLIAGAGWLPRLVCRWSSVISLLRIGLPLTASTLVQLGRYRLFVLVIGATAGAAPLGEVHMAFRLVDTVRERVFTALWQLMLPAMSARQQELAALRRVMDRWLGLAALVVLPLLGMMAVMIVPLTRLLLGPAWVEVGPAALPLIALTAWLFLWFPAGAALIAKGTPGPALAANITAVIAMLVGVAVVRPATQAQAMAVWLVAQLVTSPYTIMMSARVLRIGRLTPIRAGLPALATTASAVAMALLLPWLFGEPWGPLGLMAARLAAGAPICLLGLAWCLTRLGLLNRLAPLIRRRRPVDMLDAELR
jgi:polysaccharide transporter, PST family